MKAKYTLLARVPDGKGNFPFVAVEIKKGQPVPVAGATAYYLRYSENGKVKRDPLGSDLQKAYDIWANQTQILSAKELGLKLPENIAPIAARLTLDKARTEFLDIPRNPGTHNNYRQVVNSFVNDFMPQAKNPKRFVDEISREDLLDFSTWLAKQPLPKRRHHNPECTRHNKCLVVAIFVKRMCGKRGIFIASDFKFHRKQVVAHTDEQLSLLYQHATTEEQFLLDFYLGTMARNAEVCHARYENLTGTTLTIYGKQHKTRTVEISPRLAKAIRGRESKSRFEYIFPNGNGGPRCRALLYYQLQQLAKRAKAKFHTEPHKLRKTGASRRYLAGEPINTLREELGHANLNVTQMYLADVKPETTKAAIAAAEFVMKPQIVRTGTNGD